MCSLNAGGQRAIQIRAPPPPRFDWGGAQGALGRGTLTRPPPSYPPLGCWFVAGGVGSKHPPRPAALRFAGRAARSHRRVDAHHLPCPRPSLPLVPPHPLVGRQRRHIQIRAQPPPRFDLREAPLAPGHPPTSSSQTLYMANFIFILSPSQNMLVIGHVAAQIFQLFLVFLCAHFVLFISSPTQLQLVVVDLPPPLPPPYPHLCHRPRHPTPDLSIHRSLLKFVCNRPLRVLKLRLASNWHQYHSPFPFRRFVLQ
ncbi:hypothetical protein B0H16DRAFT_1731612 [Mycena metata]|uniref:Uncharacterized protein n=1 Tax=Mycena metata TaxID=1033252 RepID=A0AAD7I4M8_9AGAR|nr:hypothetical protein B0H16DRAFT_1731612 [Mycena metata]